MKTKLRQRGDLVEASNHALATTTNKREVTDRTDDPVRMYLREMGAVELLSREGEIAIAKRIEAGRETMIAGLCESPLTFQALIIWRDELKEQRILLREIIDLETTYAGPEAKQAPVIERSEVDKIKEEKMSSAIRNMGKIQEKEALKKMMMKKTMMMLTYPLQQWKMNFVLKLWKHWTLLLKPM